MKERLKNTKLKIVLPGALIIMMSLLPARSIIACCGDFWSCVAAVATGGVSCAIEDFINTVNTIITSVQTLQATINKDVADVIAASKQAVDIAGADLKKLVQTAKTDLDTAFASAQQISNTFQAPPANASAIDAKLKETLPRAAAEIANLKPPVLVSVNTVQQAADMAKNQVASQVQAGTDLAKTALLAPLQSVMDILNNLLKHPEQILDPHALVDSIILTVTVRMASTMDQMTDILLKNANATLETARPPTQAALDQAARGKQIFLAMQVAIAQRNQPALDQLLALLPLQAVTGVAPTTVTGTMSGSTTVVGTPAGNQGGISRGVISSPAHQKLTVDALARLNLPRSQSKTLAAKWKATLDRDWGTLKKQHEAVLHPVVPANANNSLKTYGDAMLANQDKAQLEASRAKLIAEARARFAKDQKVLVNVERLLGQEIDRRVALLPKIPAGPR